MLTEDHPFPQIAKHRGAQTRKGSYWGPFASAWAVNQTVQAMQRVFLLRTCADTVFANRTRPCLLFQIKRCSAPCVGRVSEAEYKPLVDQAKAFLSGKSSAVQKDLAAEMEQAAEHLEFERAAAIRDRIRGLTHVQGTDVINPASLGDADVIALHQEAGQTCVQVFFIRGGRNNGNRSFFPANTKGEEPGAVLAAFIAQFYDDKPPPPQILLNHAPEEQELLAEALSVKAGRKVSLLVPQRGEKHDVVLHAATNAREALERKLAETAGQAKLLDAVAELFGLPETPKRIEIYDNSHIMGTNAYGVMIVAGPEGFNKSAYRKFGIKSAITPGDDFAMMREVLTASLWPRLGRGPGQGIGILAGPGADRWRRRAAFRGAGGDGGAGAGGYSAGRHRQGAGPRCRPRMVLHGRPRALPAAAARPGAVFPPAPARRGAPLRHHHPPQCAQQENHHLGAGRNPWHRRGAQEGAAAAFRLGARGERGGAEGPGGGGRHQPRHGAGGVCVFPSRRADG